MNTYHVIKRQDERVVLIPARAVKAEETVLQVINAKSWLEAREKVKEEGIYHNPGYGWIT